MDHYQFDHLEENPEQYIFRPLVNFEVDGIELRNNEFYDILFVSRQVILITFRDCSYDYPSQVKLSVPANLAFDGQKVFIHVCLELMIDDLNSGEDPYITMSNDLNSQKELVIPDYIDEVYLD